MEWNFDNVKYNGKDLDRVQVDGVTVWEKAKPKFYEYLQNDGVAYINTNIISTVNTGIKVTYSYIASGSAAISGIYQPQQPRTDTLFVSSNSGATNSTLFTAHRGMTKTFGNISLNTKYTAEINYLNSGYMGFDTDKIVIGINGVNDFPILLFARYNASNANITASNSKIYSAIFTEGETIIYDFRPCEYNGKYGLWDLVQNKFYGNANSSGAFTVGNEIQYYDYLQTASGAYIDTDFKPNQDTRVIAEILLLNRNLTAVFGTRNNSAWPYNAFVLWNSPCLYYQYGDVTYSTYKLSDAIVNEHITIDLNKNVGILNNNSPVTCNTATFQTNYPFLIGNIHTASDIDPRPTPMKVYSFKMYDNGTLVRDYKPCLYNNQAGLWDSVECKFYGNANNTGTFTVGND